MQDIKVDIGLSDTQLGLLSGIAYAFFYALLGLPMARIADRGFAVAIIVVTTAVSGASVALCGAAYAFMPLALARIGVAFGDAGTLPPAQSLIAEYFSRAERPRATGIFFLGSSICAVVGFPVVGWLNDIYGWRATFVLIGLPGLAFAGFSWIVLDHFRHSRDSNTSVQTHTGRRDFVALLRSSLAGQGYFTLVSKLWLNQTFRSLLLGHTAMIFIAFGVAQWSAAFFMRSHGLGTGELGIWFSALSVATVVGCYLGGTLASRFAPNNEHLQLRAVSVILAGYTIVEAGIYLAPSYQIAMALKAACCLITGLMVAPVLSVIQTVVPSTMRATALASLYLVSNLVGMGIGPFLVGALSDLLQPALGDGSLRYALLAMCPCYMLAAFYVWRASRMVMDDVARASEGDER